jgi:hypothetical protein
MDLSIFEFKLTTRYVQSLGIKFGCLKLIFAITHLPYINFFFSTKQVACEGVKPQSLKELYLM